MYSFALKSLDVTFLSIEISKKLLLNVFVSSDRELFDCIKMLLSRYRLKLYSNLFCHVSKI